MRVKTEDGGRVNTLISYLGEPYDKAGDLALIPIVWGFEKEQQSIVALSDYTGQGSLKQVDYVPADDYFSKLSIIENNLGEPANQGLKIYVGSITWITQKGLEGGTLMGGEWFISPSQKWWCNHVGGPARWWSNLSNMERETILAEIRDSEGKKVIPIAIYLDTISHSKDTLERSLRGGWLIAGVDLEGGEWQLEK